MPLFMGVAPEHGAVVRQAALMCPKQAITIKYAEPDLDSVNATSN